MKHLYTSEAVAFVRAAIDELQQNESLTDVLTDTDSHDLDQIIRERIIDSVLFIHTAAPLFVAGLDALNAVDQPGIGFQINGNTILITFPPSGISRFIAFKAKDSPYVAGEAFPENSIEAYKQEDPYLRGTWERPAVVMRYSPEGVVLQYYSLKDGSSGTLAELVDRLIYLPLPTFESDDTGEYVLINRHLEGAINNYLTGHVLTVYKDENAKNYYEIANSFIK